MKALTQGMCCLLGDMDRFTLLISISGVIAIISAWITQLAVLFYETCSPLLWRRQGPNFWAICMWYGGLNDCCHYCFIFVYLVKKKTWNPLKFSSVKTWLSKRTLIFVNHVVEKIHAYNMYVDVWLHLVARTKTWLVLENSERDLTADSKRTQRSVCRVSLIITHLARVYITLIYYHCDEGY